MPSAGEPGTSELQSRTRPPQRILMVDDDFETRQINSLALVHSGYEVEAAADGAVAWQALNKSRYDLLITNHQMPRMSGVELLMKLYAIHMEVPVIIASESLPRDQFARYPWLKPAATLPQPCMIAELLDRVNEVLSAARVAHQQIRPSPNRQSRPSSQWFANVMILLRSPVFR